MLGMRPSVLGRSSLVGAGGKKSAESSILRRAGSNLSRKPACGKVNKKKSDKFCDSMLNKALIKLHYQSLSKLFLVYDIFQKLLFFFHHPHNKTFI